MNTRWYERYEIAEQEKTSRYKKNYPIGIEFRNEMMKTTTSSSWCEANI
jgi:hypothetical protein